tara:strand:+ start:204 stop:575 length:372 start_codon:yes stop_codon:yes gene_type:complete
MSKIQNFGIQYPDIEETQILTFEMEDEEQPKVETWRELRHKKLIQAFEALDSYHINSTITSVVTDPHKMTFNPLQAKLQNIIRRYENNRINKRNDRIAMLFFGSIIAGLLVLLVLEAFGIIVS